MVNHELFVIDMALVDLYHAELHHERMEVEEHRMWVYIFMSIVGPNLMMSDEG